MKAEAGGSSNEFPVACNLTESEQRVRREELSRRLFSGCRNVSELEDGYEFTFPGGAEWATELMHFVVFERECCPFLSFELAFDPEGGPISLRMRGPEGTRELIGAKLRERGE